MTGKTSAGGKFGIRYRDPDPHKHLEPMIVAGEISTLLMDLWSGSDIQGRYTLVIGPAETEVDKRMPPWQQVIERHGEIRRLDK